ncbi:MAG: phosphate acyltransferase PlsX [bacterium]|nr:phosphate acyltransferase PlsX [candidate division KSB1 bacterium]MDH7559169.1 phosphate acyltransferase PlsX [bacterium]
MAERNTVRVALDAMGGDNAPEDVVHGAVEAARAARGEYEIVLVGDRLQIQRELARHFRTAELPLRIHHAAERIEMGEPPAAALRAKRDASIAVAMRLHRQQTVDAVVTVGNTGAAMAAAVWNLGRLQGVARPALGALLPRLEGGTLLLDVGANVDCRPVHLLQFALMGTIFYRHVLGHPEPRVALLSVGEEESKGNAATIAASRLLRKSKLNFIGNVEGGDVLKGGAEVVVCDGFVGNILVKFAESVDRLYRSILRRKIGKHVIRQFGAFLLQPTFEGLRKIFDYQEYGGAPLLGVDGVCIVGHGRSTPRAVKNAIREAVKMVREGVNQHIAAELYQLSGERVG